MTNQQFNAAARHLLEGEEAGEFQLPMANRGAYKAILKEDWDPLDYVGRSSDYDTPEVPTKRRLKKRRSNYN